MTGKPISLAQPRTQPVRSIQPRLWRNLALGAAVTLAGPAFAQSGKSNVELAADMGAELWTVQAEGGEGGEAGAVAGAAPDVAYLAQLSIVEGHLIAAAGLYANGFPDEAIGLSYHPEAEMMDQVRSDLAAHQAQDFTPLMQAFSSTMESAAPVDQVNAALNTFRAAVAVAKEGDADQPKLRAEALVLLVKAAAHEYAGSIEAGAVTDQMAYNEAHAFLAVAREEAVALQTQDPTKAAATRIIDAMLASDEAFGDLTSATPQARDPAILLAVAARVELIASSVR